MRNPLSFFKRKYVWAITLTILLIGSTTFTLLDTFVIPKAYASLADPAESSPVNPVPINNNTNTYQPSASSKPEPATQNETATDMSYKDENISINIEKITKNGVVYYVADVQLSDISYLKTALANDTFGKNITETTSEMAEENNAIFAINGDYYGFRDTGLIIRNGVLYRDTARRAPDNQTLTIDSDGNLGIVIEGEVSGESLMDTGILQSFSFGPVLVKGGKTVNSDTNVSERANPRTAIGQVEPLHYIFVVADGRSNESNGMTLAALAQVFLDRGCTVAYNLDGGGSSAMWLNGDLINNPTDGRSDGERSISDIIYIVEGTK